MTLLHSNQNALGRNSVGDHFEAAGTGLHVRRYIEVGEHWCMSRRHAHRAVVVRSGIEYMARRDIGYAHQRIIGVRLVFIAERGTLRKAIKLRPGDFVR